MINPAIFSIKNRILTSIIILGSLLSGWLAYQNMPRFEDPEFLIRTAMVITEYPGASPTEVANEVTETLERAIQELQEVDKIESTSSAGLSLIEVSIKHSFSPEKSDLQLVWSKLRNKVNDSQYLLPPGAGPSFVNDDFGDVYGVYYLITGDGFSYQELEKYAKQLRNNLLAISGVAKITLTGLQQEAIYIEVSRERVNALGLSLNFIHQQLDEHNAVLPAGSVEIDNRRVVIQPTGSIDTLEEIKNLIISTDTQGTLLYLSDVASVTRAYQTPVKHELRYNGLPAIGLGISNVTGSNVVKMGEAIDEKISSIENQRPFGIEVHEYYHQGKVTDQAVKDFVKNVGLALFIVLVTLMIFMGSRSAIIIGAVLVLTVAATLTTMSISNIPMHRISLGALIIALGMLVDNAIVITEGILVGTKTNKKKIAVIKEVVSRSMWPLLGGTIVGILAFAPIGLAPGDTAEYTNHLFWVVMISLMYSWIFAITLVPFLAELLLSNPDTKNAPKEVNQFMQWYKRFMHIMLTKRWLPIGVTISLFILALFSFQFVKSGFFPTSTTPQIVVDYWLPEGTDINHTRMDMLSIEKEIESYEGVEKLQTLIGQGALRYMLIYEGEQNNSSYGQFLIQVEDFNGISSLLSKIQVYIDENYPAAQAKVWRFQLGPASGPKIQAEFSGPDPIILRRLADQAKTIMREDGGARSIQDDWRQPVSVIEPDYSANNGRRLGISRQDLASTLMQHFSGSTIGIFREGDTLIPIIARPPKVERDNISEIEQIQITSPITGASVPLSQITTDINFNWRDALIKKENRSWMIKAQSDPIAGQLASDLLNRIKPKIEAMELPPGYQLSWGGEFGDSKEANENLAKAMPLGFIAMVLVVVILFNAIKQPLVIWLTVPLALIGVVPGLILTGTPLEFMAILGLLSLSGLLIKNAIVLVDQMDLEISEGKARFDAVLDSAASRVRPVMMGALTTILGVVPLFGDVFFRSMAVVLVFGLSFATLLTLIVVPALYAEFFKINSNESEVA